MIEPFRRGPNLSVIGALRLDGLHLPMMLSGAFDGSSLFEYVKHCLIPKLRPGDIIIWDNVRFHKDSSVVEQILNAKATILPLPAYSPDLNPIEECISKIKTLMRGYKAKTFRTVEKALKQAIEAVTPGNARSWIKHAGYILP